MPARYGTGRVGRLAGAGGRQRVGRDGRRRRRLGAVGWRVGRPGRARPCRCVEAGDRERTGADRLAAERVVGQLVDRDAGEQMRRRDRLGRGLEEPAERRLERERRPSACRGRLDGDLVPRAGARAVVRRDPGGRRIVNATSSAVTGSPSCQRASSRRWKVQIAPVGSTVQRSARSGTSDPGRVRSGRGPRRRARRGRDRPGSARSAG